MNKEYICLDCQTRQDKPSSNPLGWCEACGGQRIEPLSNVKYVAHHRPVKMSGYVWLGRDEDFVYRNNSICYLLVDFIIGGNGDPKHDPQIVSKQWKAKHVHLIKADDVRAALKIIKKAIGGSILVFAGGGTLVDLSQEQVEYICTIKEYKEGKFYFSRR